MVTHHDNKAPSNSVVVVSPSSFPEEFGATRQSFREDLAAVLGDEELVFELCAALAVFGDAGPAVGPGPVLVGALVDHGLDGEDVSGFHDADGLVVGVVGHVGVAVEEFADAVAAVGFDDAEVLRVGVFGDDVADFAVLGAGAAVLDGLHQTLVGGLDQALAGSDERGWVGERVSG